MGLMGIEIRVNNAIKDSMISTNQEQAEKLKKFATILRIPRLHFEYIEKHGVFEFIEYCEDIIKKERALEKAGIANKLKLELRNDYSVTKVTNRHKSLSSRLTLGQKEVRQTDPFNLDVTMDIRRDDHKDHYKTQSQDQKILSKLNSIKELNKNSLLDLSELIHKHKDAQPTLLANL